MNLDHWKDKVEKFLPVANLPAVVVPPTDVPPVIIWDGKQIEQVKADMRRFAKEVLQPWRENSKSGRAAVQSVIRNLYRHMATVSADGMIEVVTLARDARDVDAHAVLHQLFREYEHSNKPKPPTLASYIMEDSKRREDNERFRLKRGRKMQQHIYRNISIMYAIAALCDLYPGLRPTGRSAYTISAAEIVGEVIWPRLSYAAAAKVWEKYKGAAPTMPGFWMA